MSWLRALAARAPAPVFPALGAGGEALVRHLSREPGVERVRSPRHATVLLVAGEVPERSAAALRRVHAQLPRPCATLWYRSRPLPGFPAPRVVSEPAELPDALAGLHRAVLAGEVAAEPYLLPDAPPADWEGRGDHGQGGEGMMGGVPYGRPMAMTAADLRDGLALDALELTVGPFLPGLPPGLELALTLQGDVVQACAVRSAPYPEPLPEAFLAALHEPVPVARLELERARHHLARLAGALEVSGSPALAGRLLAAGEGLAAGDRLAWLRPVLRGCGLLAAVVRRSGVLTPAQAAWADGPAARAAGLGRDARVGDPVYRELGFQLLRQRDGDTRARWRQWLAEIEQSLDLAARAAAGDVRTAVTGSVETTRGRLGGARAPADASGVLEALLPGLEWSEAMAAIASLPCAAPALAPGDPAP